jgi:SAM-dependent methyltransferase
MDIPAEEPRVAPASDYDTFVNWDARLARELPFFERLFAEVGVGSLIDVGAGSAKHAIAFAEQGYSVDAVDPDDSMLAQAEANIAEAAERIAAAGGELRLVRGGFGELAGLGLGPADALTCTGNALPHVDGIDGLRAAFADFGAVIRPQGVLVLHLLNHTRLIDGKTRSIPPIVRDVPEGTRVFLRLIDYPLGADYLDLDFVTLTRDRQGAWNLASRRSAHTALPFELLRAELASAGFESVQAFGSHDGRAFDADNDESVIVVARRAQA